MDNNFKTKSIEIAERLSLIPYVPNRWYDGINKVHKIHWDKDWNSRRRFSRKDKAYVKDVMLNYKEEFKFYEWIISKLRISWRGCRYDLAVEPYYVEKYNEVIWTPCLQYEFNLVSVLRFTSEQLYEWYIECEGQELTINKD